MLRPGQGTAEAPARDSATRQLSCHSNQKPRVQNIVLHYLKKHFFFLQKHKKCHLHSEECFAQGRTGRQAQPAVQWQVAVWSEVLDVNRQLTVPTVSWKTQNFRTELLQDAFFPPIFQT